ncbi:hypothetical protein TRFO_29577 [Tritrichomonas foetus]|uniref:Uncharacterized protein n=1 Tax=Tritrichomonas foetus TaxID=1144522 RepID=A0A1J4JX84_9EUKA|nr:hypothetical protein TRFO_29577 [Tritrichomonas foetus]|eukprot:OHT03072.1 hypothetical protein TRFO_29577 [Tritrichomonas foetus]
MEFDKSIKENIIRQVDLTSHGFSSVPFFFAENGLMPNSKGKTKSCFILANMAGIYFFRSKKLRRLTDLKDFISIFDINEIRWVDQKRRDIISMKHGNTFFMCDHSDILLSNVKFAHEIFCEVLPELPKLQFTSFPTPVENVKALNGTSVKAIVENMKTPQNFLTLSGSSRISNESILSIYYVCSCLARELRPSEPVVELLRKIDRLQSQTLVLDQRRNYEISNLKSFVRPIVSMSNINTVIFKSFAPMAVCRYIHKFLKSQKINTIVLEGYSTLDPESLKIDEIKANSPVSFTIRDCNFDDNTFNSFLTELFNFSGDFQKFSLDSIVISFSVVETLINSVRKSRSLRTVEVFECNGIDLNDVKSASPEKILEFISIMFQHCRFCNKLSVSNWKNPTCINILQFLSNDVLVELDLMNQNLIEVSKELILPPSIHFLNFSGSIFTFTSLTNLLTILSGHFSPMSLNLSDIQMSDQDWYLFYQSLSNLNQPIRCLRELDWSDNKIDMNVIQSFTNYFIWQTNVRFLSINRIFGGMSLSDLRLFVTFLPKKRLLGLSLDGNNENNFSGIFKQLIPILKSIETLVFISLNNQMMTEDDAQELLNYVKMNSKVLDISCDGSSINHDNKFFEFYENLVKIDIAAIGKPYSDIVRLFGQNLEALSQFQQFNEFRQLIRTRQNSITANIRANFFTNDSDTFSTEDLLDFSAKYPTAYFDVEPYDLYGISPLPVSNAFFSPYQRETEKRMKDAQNMTSFNSLAEVQMANLQHPLIPPNAFTPTFVNSDSFSNSKSYGIRNSIGAKGLYMDNTQISDLMNHSIIAENNAYTTNNSLTNSSQSNISNNDNNISTYSSNENNYSSNSSIMTGRERKNSMFIKKKERRDSITTPKTRERTNSYKAKYPNFVDEEDTSLLDQFLIAPPQIPLEIIPPLPYDEEEEEGNEILLFEQINSAVNHQNVPPSSVQQQTIPRPPLSPKSSGLNSTNQTIFNQNSTVKQTTIAEQTTIVEQTTITEQTTIVEQTKDESDQYKPPNHLPLIDPPVSDKEENAISSIIHRDNQSPCNSSQNQEKATPEKLTIPVVFSESSNQNAQPLPPQPQPPNLSPMGNPPVPKEEIPLLTSPNSSQINSLQAIPKNETLPLTNPNELKPLIPSSSSPPILLITPQAQAQPSPEEISVNPLPQIVIQNPIDTFTEQKQSNVAHISVSEKISIPPPILTAPPPPIMTSSITSSTTTTTTFTTLTQNNISQETNIVHQTFTNEQQQQQQNKEDEQILEQEVGNHELGLLSPNKNRSQEYFDLNTNQNQNPDKSPSDQFINRDEICDSINLSSGRQPMQIKQTSELVKAGKPVEVHIIQGKSRKPIFESAAGKINTPMIRIPGANKLNASMNRIVKLVDEIFEIPSPSELESSTNFPDYPSIIDFNESRNEENVNETHEYSIRVSEIEDVMVFSKNTIASPPPPLVVLSPLKRNEIDNIYNGNDLPYTLPNTSSGKISYSLLTHPLQNRRRNPPPKVTILGVPKEW